MSSADSTDATPRPPVAGSRRPLGPLRKLGLFCLALLGGAVALSVLWQVLHLPPQLQHGTIHAWPQLGAGGLALGLVLCVTAVLVRRYEGRGLDTVGLPMAPRAVRTLVLGMVIGAIPPMLIVLLSSLTAGVEIDRPAWSFRSIFTTTLPMAAALILLSSWEEIALRGYPMQLLASATRPRAAAVISGVSFGLLHAGNPAANIAGLVYTAIGGVLLATLVQRTGALWLACGYHAGWNVTAALVFGLRESGVVHQGALAGTRLLGPGWLTGGTYGFEAAPWSVVVEILVLVLCLRFAPKLPAERSAQPWFAGARRP